MQSLKKFSEVVMSKNKKKTGILSLLLIAAVISAVGAVSLTPILKFIYPLKYEKQIAEYSKEFNLDKYLVMGIISAESNFDVDAESHKSAHGLMQLRDETALWCIHNLDLDISEDSIREPNSNIRIGCAYMRYLTDLYKGNVVTAAAAYNAGLGNVNKWLADKRYSKEGITLAAIPFSETKAYVEKVQKRAKIYERLYP